MLIGLATALFSTAFVAVNLSPANDAASFCGILAFLFALTSALWATSITLVNMWYGTNNAGPLGYAAALALVAGLVCQVVSVVFIAEPWKKEGEFDKFDATIGVCVLCGVLSFVFLVALCLANGSTSRPTQLNRQASKK
jgi:hypothetical protein